MAKRKQPSKKSNHFFSKPVGFVVTGTVLIVLAYALGSLALDSGSLLQWGLTIIALIWGLIRIVQGVIRRLSHQK